MRGIVLLAFGAITLVQGVALGASASHKLSFAERVKKAKFIFIGTPVSEGTKKQTKVDADMVVSFKVDRVFKGNPGNTVDVAYLLEAPIQDPYGFPPTYRRNMRPSYKNAIEKHIKGLVY